MNPIRHGVCERCARGIWSRDGDGSETDERLGDRAGDDTLLDGSTAGDARLGNYVCRHHCAYPARLRMDPSAPDVLCVRGGPRQGDKRPRRRSRPGPADEHRPTTRALCAGDDLERELAQTLERVRAGEDTLDALRAGEGDTSTIELTLVELELRGLLRRGLGGRYLPTAEAGATRRLHGSVSSGAHS